MTTGKLLSADEGKALLAPHLADIEASIRRGWNEWRKLLRENPSAASLSPSSRARMVYDWITEDAQRRFGESPEVHVSLKRRFLTLTFGDGKAVLRFKKYRGRRLRTGGIPTQQRLEFQYQWQALDGMELTNLVAGYLLDATEMEQAVIAVTCPMGDEVIWRIDLDGGEGIEPTVPIAPSDDRDGPIIRSSIRKDEDTRNSQKE